MVVWMVTAHSSNLAASPRKGAHTTPQQVAIRHGSIYLSRIESLSSRDSIFLVLICETYRCLRWRYAIFILSIKARGRQTNASETGDMLYMGRK